MLNWKICAVYIRVHGKSNMISNMFEEKKRKKRVKENENKKTWLENVIKMSFTCNAWLNWRFIC